MRLLRPFSGGSKGMADPSVRHNDSDPSRGYRHHRSVSQASTEYGSAHPHMATSVPSLSQPVTLDPTTTSRLMSIPSIVDHSTGSGYLSHATSTALDEMARLPVPPGPHGFPPELMHGASTSDDSPFYSDDSCYSPNPDYPQARIAGQPYLPGQERQQSPLLVPSYGAPYYLKSPMVATSTFPAWYDTESVPAMDMVPSDGHFEGGFLQSVGTPTPRNVRLTILKLILPPL